MKTTSNNARFRAQLFFLSFFFPANRQSSRSTARERSKLHINDFVYQHYGQTTFSKISVFVFYRKYWIPHWKFLTRLSNVRRQEQKVKKKKTMFTHFRKKNYFRTCVAYFSARCTCASFSSVDKYVSRQSCKYNVKSSKGTMKATFISTSSYSKEKGSCE